MAVLCAHRPHVPDRTSWRRVTPFTRRVKGVTRLAALQRGDSPDLTTPAGPLQNSSWQKLMLLQPFGYCALAHLPAAPAAYHGGCSRYPAIGDMFSSLSFNQRARRFWNERNHAGKPGVAREISTPSRRTNAAGRSVVILLFPVSVALIAAAITGVFFGIGFWLLASPARQTISDSGRDPSRLNGNALKTSEAVLPLAGATETPHSAAVNLIPGSPLGQRPAAAETTSPQQNNVMRELSAASPNGEPPFQTASVPQPVSSAAVSLADPMPLASPPAVAAADGALSASIRGPSTRDGRSAHTLSIATFA